MVEPISPVLLDSVSCPSVREMEGAGPTTLTIETWSDGNSRFQWKVNDAAISTLDLCINAFFNLLQTLPEWFAAVGQPGVYHACGSSMRLICMHLEDAPQIGIGVIDLDDAQPQSMVLLDRGMVISMLDKIGHRLAELEDVFGCSGPDDDAAEIGDDEDDDSDDPFAGLDVTVRH